MLYDSIHGCAITTCRVLYEQWHSGCCVSTWHNGCCVSTWHNGCCVSTWHSGCCVSTGIVGVV